MTQTATHRDDLQGLRGIAVLLVVLYHAGTVIPGGFIGVDVFFVLSGFVIGSSILRESARTGSLSLSGFYSRRVRRILPASALMAMVTLPVFAYTLSPFGNQQVMAKTSAAASVWLSNMALAKADGGNYFGPAAEENPFLHTWSLGVEEQFYIFLPVVMVAIFVSLNHRPGSSTRRLRTILGVTAALSFAISIALVNFRVDIDPGIGLLRFQPAKLGFYLSLGRFWELLAGVLLATVPLAATNVNGRVRIAIGTAGVAILVGTAFAYDDFTSFPGLNAVPPVAATLLLIWAGTVRDAPVARSMSVAPLRFIGDNSYSWYLWHWPAIVLTTLLWSDSRSALLIAGALSLVPAVLSRTFVEEPLHRNRSIVGRKALGLAAICVGVPLAMAAVVYIGAGERWGLDEPAGWADIPAAREAGCHVNSVSDIAAWDSTDCLFDTADSTGTIMIVGDSHASSLSTAVTEAGNSLGYDVGVWSGSGCPFIADVSPIAQFDECREWVARAFEVIDEIEPEVVVIANRATIYTRPTTGEPENPAGRIADTDGKEAASTEEALAIWEAGTAATIEALEDRGISTIILGTVPEFWPDFIDDYSLARSDLSPQMPTTEIEIRQAGVDGATQRAVAAFSTATFLDPTDTLCPDEICRPYDAEGWLYYDPDHLNGRGSSLLTPLVTAALATVLA